MQNTMVRGEGECQLGKKIKLGVEEMGKGKKEEYYIKKWGKA